MEKIQTSAVLRTRYAIVKTDANNCATSYVALKDGDCFTKKIGEAIVFESLREARAFATGEKEDIAIISIEAKLITHCPGI